MAWILFLDRQDEWYGAFGVVRAHHVEGGHLRPLAWLLVHLWGKAGWSAAVGGPWDGDAIPAPYRRKSLIAARAYHPAPWGLGAHRF